MEIILGIDPGYDRMGYGIIKKELNNWKVLHYGCVQTSKKQTHLERLKQISDELKKIIEEFKPIAVGVEELFFVKNAKTAIKVGEARGVILLTCAQFCLPVFEFTPMQVKQLISGYGGANKEQIQKMVGLTFGIKTKITPDDAADALAIAYCCGQDLNFKKRCNRGL